MSMRHHFILDAPDPTALRHATGMTQSTLAALVCVSGLRTWQKWEHGDRDMPLGLWELALLKAGCHPTHNFVQTQGLP